MGRDRCAHERDVRELSSHPQSRKVNTEIQKFRSSLHILAMTAVL